MFLSYGRRSVLKGLGEVNTDVVNEILTALGRLHKHGILHRDAEPRNMLCDKRTGWRNCIPDNLSGPSTPTEEIGRGNGRQESMTRTFLLLRHSPCGRVTQ
ncbi:hypothetical protein FALCPG4_015798 [Fusarium falciforme]